MGCLLTQYSPLSAQVATKPASRRIGLFCPRITAAALLRTIGCSRDVVMIFGGVFGSRSGFHVFHGLFHRSGRKFRRRGMVNGVCRPAPGVFKLLGLVRVIAAAG